MILSQPKLVCVCSVSYLLCVDLIGVIVSRQGDFDPSIAEPKGPPSVEYGNCCQVLKTDTNQQMQHVSEGDFYYGPAYTREKTLFSQLG